MAAALAFERFPYLQTLLEIITPLIWPDGRPDLFFLAGSVSWPSHRLTSEARQGAPAAG